MDEILKEFAISKDHVLSFFARHWDLNVLKYLNYLYKQEIIYSFFMLSLRYILIRRCIVTKKKQK